MDSGVLVYAYHFYDPRRKAWVLSADRATLEAIARHGWRILPGTGRPAPRHSGLLPAARPQYS